MVTKDEEQRLIETLEKTTERSKTRDRFLNARLGSERALVAIRAERKADKILGPPPGTKRPKRKWPGRPPNRMARRAAVRNIKKPITTQGATPPDQMWDGKNGSLPWDE